MNIKFCHWTLFLIISFWSVTTPYIPRINFIILPCQEDLWIFLLIYFLPRQCTAKTLHGTTHQTTVFIHIHVKTSNS
jgi:hypothetical protein